MRLNNLEKSNYVEKCNNKMIQEITNLVEKFKSNLANKINKSIIYVYWNKGRIIVSNIMNFFHI